MSNGIPTPWELYAVAPYQYPLNDIQPVVRIPVSGPDPFNTLVVVRGQVWVSSYRKSDGKLQRRAYTVGTNFSLIGFDPRASHPATHSSTAALQMMQSSDDTSFVWAVDAIDDGYFDDTGRWNLVVRVADLSDNVIAAATAYYSSWVLCYEPPLPTDQRREKSAPIRYSSGVRQSLIELSPTDTSLASINLDSLIKARQRRKQRMRKCCELESSTGLTKSPAATAMSFALDSVDPLFGSISIPKDE